MLGSLRAQEWVSALQAQCLSGAQMWGEGIQGTSDPKERHIWLKEFSDRHGQ